MKIKNRGYIFFLILILGSFSFSKNKNQTIVNVENSINENKETYTEGIF